MDPTDQDERLSRMATHWSLVVEAHEKESRQATPARAELAQRYMRAAFRYLLGAVRDTEVAEELCQDFAVKMMDGKLRGADPEKGRFRDYLKVVLINLVNDHQRRRAKNPDSLPDQLADQSPLPTETLAGSFEAVWRDELLERTWESLREERPNYYAVLRLRLEYPDMTSAQLAELFEQQHEQQISAAGIRKTIERAHGKYAHLLVHEVAGSLPDAGAEEVEHELKALDLLKYCKSALEKWQATGR